jgi:hypothetical protein
MFDSAGSVISASAATINGVRRICIFNFRPSKFLHPGED